uniref:non-specific serine/threonine protein kinase n=1 Tax=Kalanchoe fedtschenkoi TaxID=63787 RepID=A0A7N0V8K3_KALFE
MRSSGRVRLPAILGLALLLLLRVEFIFAADYVPVDQIFLDCGASAPETTDADGRKWTTDNNSKFLLASSASLTSPAATQDPSVPEIPFMTARLFRSNFTYSFPVTSGRKFIRLYFYPAAYGEMNASDAVFSVTAGGGSYTLLKSFNASQTALALNFAFIVKEYSVNVDSEQLSITFSPSSNSSNSYAYVNGIEIVSAPDIYNTEDGSSPIVGQSTPYMIGNTTALENLYRLNVGGSDISPSHDTGMFRSWYDDSSYIYGAGFGVTETAGPNMTIRYPKSMPTYVAPVNVYETARSMGPNSNINLNFNLSWILPVDSGFSYLVRMHFCEIDVNITKVNQKVFQIFISNQTADDGADVAGWTNGNGIPIYKDFVVLMAKGKPQEDLWIELHPNTASKPQFYDSILNGLEVFKISDASGNLAGLNPIPVPRPVVDPSKVRPVHGSGKSSLGAIVGGVCGAFAALLAGFIICFISRRRRQAKKDSSSSDPSGWLPLSLYGNSHSAGSGKTNTTGSQASSIPSNLCRHFSFAEIKAATKNFDDSLILGVGGFGKVYKGEIDGGTTKVAIKRANPSSEQGAHEFQTEIEMLSKLRHRHLVSLIGYCEDKNEMILVYDYMGNGTLREHLYKTQNPPLSWKQRLDICIGAARGLHYLHTGAKYTIIHRDVKTTNILLDEKWVAKVSDFGLSKTGPTLDHTHVSTVVKGSFGYLDPEYFRRQQLTDKSDVYSFGVVLFELLCARPALNPTLPKEQVSLAEWAVHCHKKGMLDQIMDPLLKGKIAPECFKKVAETAVKCVSDQSIDRPSMGDVLWNLEFAQQLQLSAEESGKIVSEMDTEEGVGFEKGCGGKKDPNASPGFESNMTDSRSSGISMSIGGRSLASEDSDGLTPSAVFSQIMNPKGR